ncbi:MAG: hypothetical protein ACE14T_10155 [Syntrophales bacterium]
MEHSKEYGQMTFSFDAPQLTAEQQAVWDCIKDRRGKGSAILGPEISRITGLDYTTVRAIVAHLINFHHKLIGSNGRGYFIPTEPQEVDEVVRSLEHRGIMIFLRASKLRKQAIVDVMHQAYLRYENAANQK